MAKKEKSMGEFLPESNAASVLPIVKSNEPFIIKERGKNVYIGMLLDVAKIGGINKKTVGDKDKGGVIELIKNGNIDAYITQELNDTNQLLFIPTAKTIDHLADYGMFRKVSGYEFVKLNDKLEIIEHTEVFETYDVFRSIITGQAAVIDYVKPADVIQAGSAEDPTVTHNPVTDAVGKIKEAGAAIAEKAAPVTDKIAPVVAPVAGKIKEGAQKVAEKAKESFNNSAIVKDMHAGQTDNNKPSDKPASKADPEAVAEKIAENGTAQANNAVNNAPAQPVNEAPPEEEPDSVYSETQVIDTIERVFHADNLDLPLSSEPFDQVFTISNHLIKFNIDSRDTYVNERLNLMAADANRDLEKLRADNLAELRKKYFMLMTARILEIQKSYDIANANTTYGHVKSEIDATKDDALNHISDLIAQRRKALEDDFEKRLDEYCDAKAKEARSDFKARYEPQHNARINAVENQVRADIEARYMNSMSELYQERRNDALTVLDLNTTGVLNELSNDYKQMFEEENKLYIARANEMREYAKELHQEDAKRLAIEEEHNRISNEVNDARAEAAAKIELIKKEYETAQAALEARTSATLESAETKTQLIQDQMESRTRALMADKDELQKQLDAALYRADKAQEIVKADYEHRLMQAQDDRDSWKQTLDAYKDQHRHNNKLAAILVVAITIAAIAGGFVAGGVYWNRVVAGELAGADSGSSEIKIISPEVVNGKENTDEEKSEVRETAASVIEKEEDSTDVSLDAGENKDKKDADKAFVTGVTDEESIVTTAPEKAEKAETTAPVLNSNNTTSTNVFKANN